MCFLKMRIAAVIDVYKSVFKNGMTFLASFSFTFSSVNLDRHETSPLVPEAFWFLFLWPGTTD